MPSLPRALARGLVLLILGTGPAAFAWGAGETGPSADAVALAEPEPDPTAGDRSHASRGLARAPLPEVTVAAADGGTVVEVVERTEVPFGSVEKKDATRPVGERAVGTAGVPGETVVVFRVESVDGVEVSRHEVLRTAVEPVDEVILVGTKTASRPWNPGPAYEGDPRSIGRSMVATRGWGEDQWVCLDRLWTKESNWNPYAQNPSSGAYGIPQALPGSKMGTVADDWRTNPATQITWGLNYISGRYGTPCGAWSHSVSVGWY